MIYILLLLDIVTVFASAVQISVSVAAGDRKGFWFGFAGLVMATGFILWSVGQG